VGVLRCTHVPNGAGAAVPQLSYAALIAAPWDATPKTGEARGELFDSRVVGLVVR